MATLKWSRGPENVTHVNEDSNKSPYLFNVYIDDLSITLSACSTGCFVRTTIMNHFMYADDLVIFSSSSVGLRARIYVCEKYGISHEIRFNYKKSAIVICRGQYMKNVYPPLYTINGEMIKEVDSVRYLGHIISSNGKDNNNNNYIINKCI